MSSPDVFSQYKLFLKYWGQGIDKKQLGDLKTANSIREKSINGFDALVTDKNKIDISEVYAQYAEFLFDYFLILNEAKQDTGRIHSQMSDMAKRAVALDENSFLGHYYLAIYSSWNIMKPTSGKGKALYTEGDLATNIVGSAFTLLGKGLALGATAAGAGITRSTFNNHVVDMMEAFAFALDEPKPSAFDFLTMVPKVFNLADYCEENGFGIWREMYSKVCSIKLEKLDYSEIDPEKLDLAKQEASELYIIADSKV